MIYVSTMSERTRRRAKQSLGVHPRYATAGNLAATIGTLEQYELSDNELMKGLRDELKRRYFLGLNSSLSQTGLMSGELIEVTERLLSDPMRDLPSGMRSHIERADLWVGLDTERRAVPWLSHMIHFDMMSFNFRSIESWSAESGVEVRKSEALFGTSPTRVMVGFKVARSNSSMAVLPSDHESLTKSWVTEVLVRRLECATCIHQGSENLAGEAKCPGMGEPRDPVDMAKSVEVNGCHQYRCR